MKTGSLGRLQPAAGYMVFIRENRKLEAAAVERTRYEVFIRENKKLEAAAVERTRHEVFIRENKRNRGGLGCGGRRYFLSIGARHLGWRYVV